ncbi:RING-type domain-containing protein [Aphelenchoides bicaudatus]|nr:RING-type domain-containing protein [Aphelenchoides bicaudatus]
MMDSLQVAGVSDENKPESYDDEVVEPRFKYERIIGDAAKTLDKDAASCVAVHDKFLVIGFSTGRVGFFDHLGNGHFECKTKIHRCSVSHISVDGPGNYVISCANDKQVCVQGFGHSDYNQNIECYPAAKCVALSEDFSKYGTGQRFITANQSLTLHERGFFGKQKTDTAGLPYKKVEIINQWTIDDFFIAGVSFTISESPVCEQAWEEIVLFGFALNERTDSNNADNSFFDDTRSVFSDVSAFSTINVMQDKQVSAQLMLIKPLSMTNYSAHPCSIDDRVSWFLENELFAEALQCALKDPDALNETSVADIGRRLINDLIKKDQFPNAAAHLNEVCGRSKQEWEYYCEIFEKHGEILKLVPYIPTSSPQLEPECYEWILTAALYARPRLFKRLVLEYNPDIYRAASIIDKILKRIADENSKGLKETTMDTPDIANLYQSLAHLLAYVRNFQKAIDIYLLLKDKAIFGVINRYNLFLLVKDRIVELMQIDEDLARSILIENADLIPVNQVIVQLSKHPKLQMLYLNKLHARGEANEYSDLMIRLFAEYERKMLLPFLKKCENYKIDQALDVCRRKNFVDEMVYLLGRSGNRVEALDVIMTKMDKIEAAIAFCTDHEDDIELWNRLIDLCMNKPKHITKLLTTAGTYIDPLIVIKKIPTDIEIPDLQKALLKVLRDYELQINLLRDSSKVGLDDLLCLFEQRVKSKLSSTFIDFTQKCYLCSELIVAEVPDSKTQQEILFLSCGHILHRKCLETDSTKSKNFTCPSCFFQCHLDESPSGSKPSSPQKIPNSISQANMSNFWMN